MKINGVVLALGVMMGMAVSAMGAAATGDSGPREQTFLPYGLYIHFDISTMAGYENAKIPGKVPAERFGPVTPDVGQWARVAKDAGMSYAVLTVKHEVGFCLWDSVDYPYDVGSVAGQKDILQPFLAACHAEGLKAGFHYSIPDAYNEGQVQFEGPVGAPYFNQIRKHITELHTKYKEIDIQAFDVGVRLSKPQRDELTALIRKLNPKCIILGFDDEALGFNCDPQTVIKDWFWKAGVELATAEQLQKDFAKARGEGKSFILNVGPDPKGRIPDEQIAVLMKLKELPGEPTRPQAQATGPREAAAVMAMGPDIDATRRYVNGLTAAPSVQLWYTAPDSLAYYNEVTVQESQRGTYFCVCGFKHGYFGIQESTKPGGNIAIFSVWDPGKQNNPNQVAEEQRVKVIYSGEGVRIIRFGNEGTGGQSTFPFDWKVGQTIRCLVRAKVQGRFTTYSAFIFLPDEKTWKHLASFQTITEGDKLKNYYSFVEDFRRTDESASQSRRALYGNGWVQTPNGKWQPLTEAMFTANKAPRMDIDAGVDSNRFYLQTGGDTRNTMAVSSKKTVPASALTWPRDLPNFNPASPQKEMQTNRNSIDGVMVGIGV
jgi:hypothetical protein